MKLTAGVALVAAIVSLIALAPSWVYPLIVAWVLLQLVFALLRRPASRAAMVADRVVCCIDSELRHRNQCGAPRSMQARGMAE